MLIFVHEKTKEDTPENILIYLFREIDIQQNPHFHQK